MKLLPIDLQISLKSVRMKYSTRNCFIQIPNGRGKMVFFFVFRMPSTIHKIERVKNVIQFKRHHASWMPIFLTCMQIWKKKMEFYFHSLFTCQCETIVRPNRSTRSDNLNILFDLISVCKVFCYAQEKKTNGKLTRLSSHCQMKPSVLQIADFNILYDDWKINVSKFIYKSEGLY